MSFPAIYQGVCGDCGRTIFPGNDIEWSLDNDGYVHARHASDKPAEVCAECWLEKPCACE